MNNEIKYFKPTSISQACQLLIEEKNSLIIAGGTDLIVKVRNGMLPDLKAFVDVSALQLNKISEENGNLVIGSGCTMTTVTENKLVKENMPTLAKAASTVGALQIRNSATIGGNTANSSPAGDTIPALFSLDALVRIQGINGTREVPIEKFFTGPGKNILEKGEILVEFVIPMRKTRGEFLKLGERKAHAISKINLAITAWKNADGKNGCRIAMGSVAPTVIRVTEAEKLIEEAGLPLSPEKLEQAINFAIEAAKPISDVRSSKAYRKQMAGVLLKRAIKTIS